MAKVLITSEYFGKFSNRAKELLIAAGHEVIDNPYGHKFLIPDEIIPYIKNADAIICDLESINRQVIDAATRLKIVARRGVGVDSVDVAACAERGIEVARTVDAVPNPVAELVVAYMMHFSRNVAELDKSMKKGIWEKKQGSSVRGKTLGLLGLGNIASRVAEIARAMGMRILYYDINRNNDKERDLGAVYIDMDGLFRESDFISLHIPLLPNTKGLINDDKFALMKKTAYLINTARGGIVCEDGLYCALKEGKIAGAAIDVFESEPCTDSILRKLDNVILTPHVATFTTETFIEMDVLSAKNIIKYFANVPEQDILDDESKEPNVTEKYLSAI